MRKEKYKEVDVASVIVDYLSSKDWDVYQEVGIGTRSADIIAVKDNKIWAIETKTSLSFQVIAQALYWKVSYRSVGVPFARIDDGRKLAFRVCKQFGVGIIEVDMQTFNAHVYVESEKQNDSYQEKSILSSLTSYHKSGIAGSMSGGAITPYKVTIMKVKEFIASNPGCTINDIISDLGKCHYHSESSAKQSIRTALNEWEKSWCISKYGRTGYAYFIREQI